MTSNISSINKYMGFSINYVELNLKDIFLDWLQLQQQPIRE